MTRHTLRSTLLARLPRRDDDRGSMAFLMLVIIMTVALGGILLSTVINQDRTSRFDQTRIHSLGAARVGIDVVLGQIRAAQVPNNDPSTDEITGDDSKLPCGPWTGMADNKGIATYATTIVYYYRQPLTTANQMVCTNEGPYYAAAANRTPHFAQITSTGCDGTLNAAKTACASTTNGTSVGRTITTTFVFKTNDVNISGGTIMVYPAGASHFCMDAGTNPAVGSPITLQPCSTATPPIPQQVWAYRPDLSIELVSTSSTTTPLCIDTGNQPSSHSAGAMLLEACTVSDVMTWCGDGVTVQQYEAQHPNETCSQSPMCPAGETPAQYAQNPPHANETCSVSRWSQQWSVDDNAHLRGALTDQSDTDGWCINVASQTAGTALTLASCAGGVTDTSQTWVPSPTTGAGMAGANNQQLVNYQQFATCLDVTGQDVNAVNMILYTCKQDPDPTKVRWNQKFTPSPALGTGPTQTLLVVTRTTDNTVYCLKSPLTAGGYPVLSGAGGCPASVAAAAGTGYLWTVSQRFDATGHAQLPYANRYTIRDISGLCLSLGNNSDMWSGQYYKAVVTGCDGGTEQKWNAAASLGAASLTNTHETTSGS